MGSDKITKIQRDLLEAAGKPSISRNTAHNQLQKILDKTGTRRQQELLVRILGVVHQ